MAVAPASRALLVLTLLASSDALAEAERFDHRGSIGLLVDGGGAEQGALPFAASTFGPRIWGEVGGTYAFDYDGNELLLSGRLSASSQSKDWAIIAGYRGYFGKERLKTFFDLDGIVHVAPNFLIGPHLGLGVQYEALSVLGVFAAMSVDLGVGNGLVASGQFVIGIQARTYMFD